MLADFVAAPLSVGIAVFVGSPIVVWFSGTGITHYADAIAERAGPRHALAGLIILGIITSLPDAAVTVVASAEGNLPLAVNNSLGGTAFGLAVLTAADAAIGRYALTSVVPNPVVMLRGSMSILLLALLGTGIAVSDAARFGVGGWCWSVLVVHFCSVWMTHRSQGRFAWHPDESIQPEDDHGPLEGESRQTTHTPLCRIMSRTVLAGIAFLVAGYLLLR